MTQPPAGTGSAASGQYASRHDDLPDDGLGTGRIGATREASSADSTVHTARTEARQVADAAVGSTKDVASTVKDETHKVVAETKQQAASLLDTLRTEVGAQARTQQGRAADALHGMSRELGGMADHSQESGPLTDLARQAALRGDDVAQWLQHREPADVLESVRSYARRRPGTFLIICGLAGVLAGRLTRSTVATRTSLDTRADGERVGRGLEPSGGYSAPPPPAPTGISAGEPVYPAEAPDVVVAQPYGESPAVRTPGYRGLADSGYDQPGGDLTR
jgi:hypothetical protein